MPHPHPSPWSYKGSCIRFVRLARLMHPSLNDRSPGNKFQGCNETKVGLALKSLLLLSHRLENGKCEISHAIYVSAQHSKPVSRKLFPRLSGCPWLLLSGCRCHLCSQNLQLPTVALGLLMALPLVLGTRISF